MTGITKLISHDLSFAPYDVKWVPSSARLCCLGGTSNGAGKIAVYQVSDKRCLTLMNEKETATPIRCGTLGASNTHQRHLATGNFNGILQLWDTQRLEMPVAEIKAHETIINGMDGSNVGQHELATGSKDGCIKVWDTRDTERPVLAVKPKTNETAKDVWCVAFGQLDASQKVIAAGFEDGDIKLFDLRTSQLVWEAHVNEGVCSIECSPTGLVVSTLGGVYCFEFGVDAPAKVPIPPETTIWTVQSSPHHTDLFATTGGNGDVNLWKRDDLKKPVSTLSLSKHPVTSFDWCKDKNGLFVCSSFDQTIKVGLAKDI